MGTKPGAKRPLNAKPTPHAPIDWPSVLVHVRAGKRSFSDIGVEFGVSKGRISQKCKELGIERDLEPQIKAAAERKVAEAAMDAERTTELEGEVVEINAQIQADIILAERADVARHRRLQNGLLAELEAVCRRRSKAKMSLAERIDADRKMVETFKTLTALERAVHNIAPDTPIDPGRRVAEAVDAGFAGLKQAWEKVKGRRA